MIRKSLSELREEMRGVARGERHASPLPAAPLLAVLTVLVLTPRYSATTCWSIFSSTARSEFHGLTRSEANVFIRSARTIWCRLDQIPDRYDGS